MNDYVNENEQWEAIKAWWKKNGIQLIVVMIIGLAVGFGWRYWESHRLNQKEAASQLFDQLFLQSNFLLYPMRGFRANHRHSL